MSEGKYDEAIRSFIKSEELSPDLQDHRVQKIQCLARSRRLKEAHMLFKNTDHTKLNPSLIAQIHFAIGDMDEDFKQLNVAYDSRDMNMWLIRDELLFSEALSDPRYLEQVERMNFLK